MNFFVRAVWDEGAGVFRSESDIIGLHIETDAIGEFREALLDMAPELILTNHISGDDLLAKPLKDIIPVIWSDSSGDHLLQTSG